MTIKRNLKIITAVFILTLIDQAMKILIHHCFMGEEFYFIDSILGFKPHINSDYSWVNSLTNLGIGLYMHIFLNTFLLLLTVAIFHFISVRYEENIIINISFTFLLSGEICSLIDKLFWGGSLDYILLNGFFIFDLKDVYLTVFELTVLLCLIFNYNRFKKFNVNKFIKGFIQYFKDKLLRK